MTINSYIRSCMTSLDIPIGQKFNRLTVIGKPERKNRRWVYLCVCECGNKSKPIGTSLISGNSKSCGCLQKEAARRNGIKLGFGGSALRRLYRDRMGEARSKNRSFELSLEQFNQITLQNCYYCGCAPAQKCAPKESFGYYCYNGLDRIDSSKGYSMSNVVPCCWQCNLAKSNKSQAEFYAWIKRIAARLELLQLDQKT